MHGSTGLVHRALGLAKEREQSAGTIPDLPTKIRLLEETLRKSDPEFLPESTSVPTQAPGRGRMQQNGRTLTTGNRVQPVDSLDRSLPTA